jgi:ubiquinone/menaquinone biosynthesis C-methylase UbiE
MTTREREVTRTRLAPGRPTQPEPSVATSSAAFYGLIAPIYDGHWGQAFFSSARTQFWRHIAPRASRNGRVLDLCCGSGRFAGYLERAGYRVTGIDSSPELLVQAAERAPDSRLVCADMSSFDLAERFDAAVCFYNSLNHARDERELRLIFACVARHVLPGGHFLFDLMPEDEYLSSWNGDECVLSEDTMYELAYSYLASTRTATCRVKTRSRTESSYVRAEAVSTQRPIELTTIRASLRSAGFSLVFVREFPRVWSPGGRLLVLANRLSAPKNVARTDLLYGHSGTRYLHLKSG